MGIPAKCGILTPEEILLTENLDAVSLARVLSVGSLRAKDVAIAFCKRAAIAQQLTNCLTETFFDDAIGRGEWLDQYLAEHGRPVGPLHGVPVSLKDCQNYAGIQSTLGLVSFLNNPKESRNSHLVDTLLSLGAVLYCKTNIPQTMMTAESHNNIFGRVLNPYKLSLGAGGSSGGEGALVALRGSILGVGGDIGGSIRIPALCNGVYGFKPTPNRVPSGGQADCSRAGMPCFPGSSGPLANSFDDLDLFVREVIGSKPWNRDSSAVAVPWRTEVANFSPTKLRIGYFLEDPKFPVHPPVERGLEYARKILAAAGHEIITFGKIPSLSTAIDIVSDYWSLDNTNVAKQNVEKSGEPLVPSLQKALPDYLETRRGAVTLDDLFDMNIARGTHKSEWYALWIEHDVDVVLCPGAQTTAMPHDQFPGPPTYTLVWNLLEYPALTIPLHMRADKEIDVDKSRSATSESRYNAENVHGAPLAIQLVARGYQDEELIAASRVIDRCLKIASKGVTAVVHGHP